MIEDGQKIIDKLLADEEGNMNSVWIFAGMKDANNNSYKNRNIHIKS
jgi:hypothetical protein